MTWTTANCSDVEKETIHKGTKERKRGRDGERESGREGGRERGREERRKGKGRKKWNFKLC